MGRLRKSNKNMIRLLPITSASQRRSRLKKSTVEHTKACPKLANKLWRVSICYRFKTRVLVNRKMLTTNIRKIKIIPFHLKKIRMSFMEEILQVINSNRVIMRNRQSIKWIIIWIRACCRFSLRRSSEIKRGIISDQKMTYQTYSWQT